MFLIRLLPILFLICAKCSADELLHVSFDEVGALNYTYYGLVFEGPIRLYLYTLLVLHCYLMYNMSYCVLLIKDIRISYEL